MLHYYNGVATLMNSFYGVFLMGASVKPVEHISPLWRLDRVELVGDQRLLDALSWVSDGVDSGSAMSDLGSVSFGFGRRACFATFTGPIAASSFCRGAVSVDGVVVRAVDYCHDYLLWSSNSWDLAGSPDLPRMDCEQFSRLERLLDDLCSSKVISKPWGCTWYFGKVSRNNRRFVRVYLWSVEQNGVRVASFLRVELCYRAVTRAERESLTASVLLGKISDCAVGRAAEEVQYRFTLAGVTPLPLDWVDQGGDSYARLSVRAYLRNSRAYWIRRALTCLRRAQLVEGVPEIIGQLEGVLAEYESYTEVNSNEG